MTEQTTPVLSGKGITKRFGGLTAIDGVDFELYRGEILGLIGSNGAGKTTLFNMISGTIPMTAGALYYRGTKIPSPQASKMCRMGIGRTYQICQPFGSMTVLENVMVGAFIRHPKTKDAREAAAAVLERVGMADLASAGGSALTLPQLKRLEVARALATEPQILLLDEVIAGLNPAEVDLMIDLIRDLRDEGITVMIIEHVMRAMMQLSDRMIVLNQGRKIAEGLPADVAADPLVIQSYLGGKHS